MDQLFFTINQWMMSGSDIAIAGSFLWGVVSVLFSPCHLASIPLIIGYVGGQNTLVEGKKAAGYATLFTIGLFITIALVGGISMLLGRMMGDIGPWWYAVVGAFLILVSLSMFGIGNCPLSSSLANRITLKGAGGAFVLGLAYGTLSGSCTFGFIAPILAIISVQEQFLTGGGLILAFALGHCLPVVIAGSSASFARKFIENSRWQQHSMFFKRMSALVIAGLGLYFILQPFIAS